MIITRTPLRISFAGGGTDLPSYYRAHGGGAVTSAAIDRYMHVLVSTKFDHTIRAAYTRTENVEHLDQLQHGLIREAMRKTGVTGGIEVHTVSDIPGEGTGLGSSSSLTVGLLQALYAYRGVLKDPTELAREACEIEIERLNGALGKQDQYIAAFGGVHYFEFRSDDSVHATPIPISSADRDALGSHLSLFYTGQTRRSEGLLVSQNARTKENVPSLDRLRSLAQDARDAIASRAWEKLGSVLDEGWQLKRGLANGIATSAIDELYGKAKAAGAFGGKVAGAGGGGFLLLVHPPNRTHQIEEALSPHPRTPVRISAEGSRILFVGR